MEERNKDKHSKKAKQQIVQAEQQFADCLEKLAEEIAQRRELRLLRLVGPTCSGKTTAAELLGECLARRGKRLHTISIDDFYYDKELLHARAKGKVDYDSVKTIDLPALRRFLEELRTKESSHCPIFDFKEGKRIGYRTMACGADDLFLFEGIQVLYPEVTALFEAAGYPSEAIYIAPLTPVRTDGVTVEPNELRLLRRLVRDHKKRNTPPEQTFSLWEGVRSNEEDSIFPYVDACTYRISSSMSYELGILAPHLRRILSQIAADSPYAAQAHDILQKIEGIEPLSDTLLPEHSLYREFV